MLTIRPLICLASMFCCAFSLVHAGGPPFTREGISMLVGKDICTLEGTFPKKGGLYLDAGKEYAIEYRERDTMTALFLLEKPSQYCGIVAAALDLTSLIKKGETIWFKCHIKKEGRTRWGHIVGLANNDEGRKRFVKARLAWKVNIKEKRFELIKRESVTCDTSGYIYGDGSY